MDDHVKFAGWVIFAVGAMCLAIAYGSTNEPIWPVIVMTVGLLVVGGTKAKSRQ